MNANTQSIFRKILKIDTYADGFAGKRYSKDERGFVYDFSTFVDKVTDDATLIDTKK